MTKAEAYRDSALLVGIPLLGAALIVVLLAPVDEWLIIFMIFAVPLAVIIPIRAWRKSKYPNGVPEKVSRREKILSGIGFAIFSVAYFIEAAMGRHDLWTLVFKIAIGMGWGAAAIERLRSRKTESESSQTI